MTIAFGVWRMLFSWEMHYWCVRLGRKGRDLVRLFFRKDAGTTSGGMGILAIRAEERVKDVHFTEETIS